MPYYYDDLIVMEQELVLNNFVQGREEEEEAIHDEREVLQLLTCQYFCFSTSKPSKMSSKLRTWSLVRPLIV